MSTKRDLVEAHAFSRRRLVTAFVSGAPGGREVEPPRPARAVVGGIALGVLMIAGAALASMFAGRSPADWTDPGIVISKENGNHYVILNEDAPLQPVLNPVSAQLLMGQVEPKWVKQEDINSRELGERIGIYGAPNNVPVPDLMRNTGWTACTTGNAATRVHVGEETIAAPVTGGTAVVARTENGQHHLITRSSDPERGFFRFAMGSQAQADPLISNLGIDGSEPLLVDAKWLALFPVGPALADESFNVLGERGRAVDYADAMGTGDYRVGDLVRNSTSGQVYVLGEEEPLILDEFGVTVYRALFDTTGAPVDISDKPGRRIAELADWPAENPEALVADEACGVLDAAPGRAAVVALATDPGVEESAGALEPGEFEVAVQPGLGAHVLVGQFGDAEGGTPIVVDMDATRYRLGGPTGETAELLGFSSMRPPTVPDAWTETFTCGPELSQEAARRKPDPQVAARCGQ